MARRYNPIEALVTAGISFDDAHSLRRIAMKLHRWHELECGDGNSYGAWAIVRGAKAGNEFIHDDDGRPYLERHHYLHGKGKDYVTYTLLPDSENGAKRRLASIMARYPMFGAYIQTDPRGASLYIIHPNAMVGDALSTNEATRREWLSCNYTRGIAVHK